MLIRTSYIFLLLILSTIKLSYGAQWAVVQSPKAIIYAHPDKSAPIGYIRSGKKVKVGEIPKARGTLLPILVSGKVAWVQIKDLILQEIGSEKEVQASRIGITQQSFLKESNSRLQKFSRYSYFTSQLGFFDLGPEWKETAKAVNTESSGVPGTTFLASYLFKKTPNPFFTPAVGFGYYRGNDGNLTYTLPAILIDGNLRVVNNRKWRIEASLGLIYSPLSSIEVLQVSETGSTFGWQLSTRAHYKKSENFGYLGTIGIQTLKPDLKTSSGNVSVNLTQTTFSGYQLVGGVYFKF